MLLNAPVLRGGDRCSRCQQLRTEPESDVVGSHEVPPGPHRERITLEFELHDDPTSLERARLTVNSAEPTSSTCPPSARNALAVTPSRWPTTTETNSKTTASGAASSERLTGKLSKSTRSFGITMCQAMSQFTPSAPTTARVPKGSHPTGTRAPSRMTATSSYASPPTNSHDRISSRSTPVVRLLDGVPSGGAVHATRRAMASHETRRVPLIAADRVPARFDRPGAERCRETPGSPCSATTLRRIPASHPHPPSSHGNRGYPHLTAPRTALPRRRGVKRRPHLERDRSDSGTAPRPHTRVRARRPAGQRPSTQSGRR